MNETLQKIIDVTPLFQSFLQDNFAISISDTDKYLFIAETNTIKFPMKVGDSINQSGYDYVLETIRKTKKSFANITPREVTGTVPIKSIVSPIFDKNEIVGYFSVTINMDKIENMEQAYKKLTESLNETSTSIQGISTSARELSSMMQSIERNTIEADENVKLGIDAIALITGIAKQSNLLGLNAAIEASKAGENGKGFSVVASEMRKLAVQSKETAEQVVASLQKIEKSVHSVLKDITTARYISDNQYDATNEICKNITDIYQMSEKLVNYSKQ